MRIKLIGKGSKSQENGRMSVNQLNSGILDSESTEVLLDSFLCEFSITEIKKLMEVVVSKCRMGCVMTIIEKDFDMIFSNVAIGVQNLDSVNSGLAETKGVKSLLTANMVSNIIPSSFKITNKHFNSEDSTVTIKAKRVK